MSFLFSRQPTLGMPASRSLRLPLGLNWTSISLIGILLLAAALRLGNPGAIGNANTYYTAAVASMLQSWHNFFFAAAEPGGSVSVDKPPVGLWAQTISAYFLGVSGFAVVLPQILAGIASVALIFHLVRRWFGDLAGLLAGLALAITPVAIAVERNNTPDALLILTLLLAAWAFIKATESGRMRWLLLGATLVGIGFNIKMLQAFLPLPAFYALYLLGAEPPWRRKILNLALASALLIPVSLAWAVAVDLTPADQRPYVGGSENNSALNLIIGYNGLERLLGRGGSGGQADSPPAGIGGQPGMPPPEGTGQGRQPPAGIGGQPGMPPPGGAGQGSQPRDGGRTPGGGMFDVGQAGPLRLFQEGLAAQLSWLLPFSLLMIVVMSASLGTSWLQPRSILHRGIILWGGWLLTCVAFFSVAGFFHQYYLAMLGPALAALVGIGVAFLWRLRASRPLTAALLLLLAGGITLVFQVYALGMYESLGWWLALPLAMATLGTLLLLASFDHARLRMARLGFSLLVAALLVVPAVWSGLTTAYANTSSGLTQAYDGSASHGGMAAQPGGPGPQSEGQSLIDYLQARTQDTTYMLVVPSAQDGSDLVLATGRPVFYAGGFNGSDPVIDGDGLAELVAMGEVRYVLWVSRSGPGGASGDTGISSYLRSACTVVTDAGLSGQVTLYRCGE